MNTSHLHIDPDSKVQVDAEGLRDHCNVCRTAAGKPELTETDRKMLKQAVRTGVVGSAAEPVEQMMADLQAQEEENDRLRGELKAKDVEIAQLKKQLEKKAG